MMHSLVFPEKCYYSKMHKILLYSHKYIQPYSKLNDLMSLQAFKVF